MEQEFIVYIVALAAVGIAAFIIGYRGGKVRKWVSSWGYIGLASSTLITVIILLIVEAGEPIPPRLYAIAPIAIFFLLRGIYNLRRIKAEK